MKIESPAFADGASIPPQFSRDGGDRSPPFTIRDVPPEARSLAFIVDDPDAPHGTFTHWIVFDLAPTTTHLAENVDLSASAAREGNNGWHEPGYGGPRPPDREHRYFFRLFALDRTLDLPNGVSRAEIDRALRGHLLAEAELMGRFAPPAAPSSRT
jgi:Raf kinase inhibitor-like YbhB/YbcL family protein